MALSEQGRIDVSGLIILDFGRGSLRGTAVR
jgi:hypothetical protein